jgi:hypothetical protein
MRKSYVLTATGPADEIADAGDGSEFHNMYMKVTAPYGTVCTVALETSIDGTTWTEHDRVTGPKWAGGGMNFTEQYARPNVHDMGGVESLAVVLTANPWTASSA